MLAKSISKGAKAKNIKLESIAMAYGQHKEVITDYDLIMLAPQMASMYEGIREVIVMQKVQNQPRLLVKNM